MDTRKHKELDCYAFETRYKAKVTFWDTAITVYINLPHNESISLLWDGNVKGIWEVIIRTPDWRSVAVRMSYEDVVEHLNRYY